MKQKQILKLVSYNIQFSKHTEQIKENVIEMASLGAAIFCLQEVTQDREKDFIIDILLKELGDNWKAIYALGKEKSPLGMGNCIIWNTKVVKLTKERVILLPKHERLAIHERVFSQIAGGITVPFQRRVIIGLFTINNVEFRLSNVHLDHSGGIQNRKKQLMYLMDVLRNGAPVAHEIICGDFNNFDLLKNGYESKMHKEVIGKDFNDSSRDIDWTADLNNIDIKNGGVFFKSLIKGLNFHIRRKLDYVWVHNIKSLRCEKLPLEGSDHYPLFAELSV